MHEVFSGRVALVRKQSYMTPKMQNLGYMEMSQRCPLLYTGVLKHASSNKYEQGSRRRCSVILSQQAYILQHSRAERLSSGGGVTNSSLTPLCFKDEAPFQNMERYGKNKNMVMGCDGT